ncbi:helix-turn-helix transcriptional regulator [Kribbella sp. CA-247076]|uniref:helix-turn-helix transcriptional regulator n=1 Tax=Kribbella sp. CA-247076 TaxID=3239941 RepID=UPI003D950712
MNRIERLYALVEELRAAGRRGRTARQLAAHFEVSVRTIERDLSALGQAGVPLATKQGRGGGFTLDRSMSLPPLNFTPREAAAVAVALSRSEHVLFRKDARSALQKIMAAMPERELAEARTTADKVRLLVQPVPDPDAGVAETIWRAARDNHVLRIRYVDVGGVETVREVEPQYVVVGPNGSYLTAWCHLRADDRVFRMDRITAAERSPRLPRPRAVPEPVVDGHELRLPASALRPDATAAASTAGPEIPSANSDIGLSRTTGTLDATRRSGG